MDIRPLFVDVGKSSVIKLGSALFYVFVDRLLSLPRRRKRSDIYSAGTVLACGSMGDIWVFGNANCLSYAGGRTILESFLTAYAEYLEPAIKAEYEKSVKKRSTGNRTKA